MVFVVVWWRLSLGGGGAGESASVDDMRRSMINYVRPIVIVPSERFSEPP